MPRSNYSKGGKGAREGDKGGKGKAGQATGKGPVTNGAQMLAAMKKSSKK
tara:strand:+ start:28 stop:177 length:150 start_codon:yes stop_codon:yes gene_type:complete